MAATMDVKETDEKNQSMFLAKKYFNDRRMMCHMRQKKFLKLYPYNGGQGEAGLRKFKEVVKAADAEQRKAIQDAYNQECGYWNSTYVVNNCNCYIHAHIIATLEQMAKILAGVDYMYTDANRWGRKGEEEVDYVLKWLPDRYCVIQKDCQGKYNDHVILLENPSFTDEAQEFDHLVVGPQGVFNIETKNYAGKLYIDKAGNWIRLKKGETEWMAEENPAQQVFRHRVLLQSIVGDAIPIIDVICLAHPNLMIAGQENSSIPVIKKDLIADFIVDYRTNELTRGDILSIRDKINASKTNR